MAPRKVIGHCVTCGRERTASDQKFAGEYSGWCATCRWNKENNMATNGVSDESAAIQQAHTEAQAAHEQSDEAEAECQALIATFDDALARLLEIGKALPPVLHARRQAYWKAVGTARALAKLTGQPSDEDSVIVKPFRRDVRRLLPAGVVTDVQLWPESSLVLPTEPDPSESLNPKPDYLPSMAEPVPLRRSRP